MKKLTSYDFYIVIRSANERSLPLCLKSVRSLGVDFEVININPFWKAVIKTFKIGIKRGRRFTVGLDADIVLYKNAIDTFIRVITKTPRYWKYDFGLKDRFYPNKIWGVHVYETRALPIALENLPKNIQIISKPERRFCFELRKKEYNDINVPDIVGEHGYNQYYRDIFNRFFHRAIRNPRHKKKIFKITDNNENDTGYNQNYYRNLPNRVFNRVVKKPYLEKIIFKNLDNLKTDPELMMAYLGWQEGESFLYKYKLKMMMKRLLLLGRKLSKDVFLPMDFKKQKDIKKYLKRYGLKELEPLN